MNLLSQILNEHTQVILDHWTREQLTSSAIRPDLISEQDLQRDSREFLRLFKEAMAGGDGLPKDEAWRHVQDFLTELSRNRARKGFTPTETATFVLSLKQPIFAQLGQEVEDAVELHDELWNVTTILDRLALFSTEVFIQSREETIRRQQEEMLELSTPVVQLWPGALALPLIGTLDSSRTQVVMESLLEEIVSTGSSIAIIDITGVTTVDTLVAQHLLKTVAAARLMGAECIISGIRPQIAQTIVHLGVELGDVTTKAKLSDALRVAFQRLGLTVTKLQP